MKADRLPDDKIEAIKAIKRANPKSTNLEIAEHVGVSYWQVQNITKQINLELGRGTAKFGPRKKKKYPPQLSKSKEREIKRLFKEGKRRDAISTELGVTIGQVYRVLRNKGGKASGGSYTRQAPEVETFEPQTTTHEKDWKAEYHKAVALLIEHDILEITLD